MKTEMWVMTHKKYTEVNDGLHKTLHVGRVLSEDLGYQGDDTGDNISDKNKKYCELTGLYWLWKNHKCDIIGIEHYRRFFLNNGRMLKKEYIEETLRDYDIIVPSCLVVGFDSVREQYQKCHCIGDLDKCRSVIEYKYPEYIKAFDYMAESKLMNGYNMLITRKEIFDKYCEWLFDILFEVEKQIDFSKRDDYQKRAMGFLSERLFKVWLIKNSYRIKEQPIKLMESDEIDKYFYARKLARKLFCKVTDGIVQRYKAGQRKTLQPVLYETKQKMQPAASAKFPIWMCWWQGEENAPDLVKRCIDSVRRNMDRENSRLHIITLQNCQEYVTFSPEIIEKFNTGQISMTTLSDRLRVELLYRYGGLWIDATYYVVDDRLKSVINHPGFYTLKSNKTTGDNIMAKGRWSDNFFKSNPGFILFGFVVEAFDEYYKYMDELVEYFMIDYFIDIAYENFEEVRAAIDDCELNNPDVLFFDDITKGLLYRKDEWDRVIKNTWLFKLTNKRTFQTENIIGQPTFYGHLLTLQ